MDGVLTDGVSPVGDYVVISGRTFAEYDEVARQIALRAPVYIRGIGTRGDREHAGTFKAKMISMLGVEEFHEDDLEQARIIQRECPGCVIVLRGRSDR